MQAQRPANRLSGETSPYLLQHAHNPVDWYPWGGEALERASREDRPILLSIGYAACHWCHVMERESFEDEEIARRMSEDFVCVKVDREERPDLDDLYMAATVAIHGSGGWPMTVFLTPAQEPFFAGTYFPPKGRGGMIGFGTLLERIAEAWKRDRTRLLAQANDLSGHLRAQARQVQPSALAAGVERTVLRELQRGFDARYGGFGPAPKFPPCATLAFLLRLAGQPGVASSRKMAAATLDGMKNGGIYDQVGGGFARYSTDERWLVPHFEKMLYDNAQLAGVYLEGFQVTGDAEYERVARQTLDYVIREMQDEAGGYYCSTDADSEEEEGRFFVFTPEQVGELLDTRAFQLFCNFYDITPEGNWEGVNVLNTPRPLADVARELSLEESEARARLEESRRLVYHARLKRTPPLLDDKVLTSWNGLMIEAMARGARVLGAPRYLESAERAARHALAVLQRADGGLYRTARGGKARLAGYLEDYAMLADGLISLYEAGGRGAPEQGEHPEYFLREAERLLARMVDDFGSQEGSFFSTASDHEHLLVRKRDGHDGALPSANAVAARALLRLGRHLDREGLCVRSLHAVEAHGRGINQAPRAFVSSLCVAARAKASPTQVVLIGEQGQSDFEALRAELARHHLPGAEFLFAAPEDAERADLRSPLLKGKVALDGRATLYACRGYSCRRPITEPAEAAGVLSELARA